MKASGAEMTLQFQQLKNENEQLGKQLKESLAQLDQMRRMVFGRSSEKVEVEPDDPAPADPLSEDAPEEASPEKPWKPSKGSRGGSNKRGAHEMDTSNIPRFTSRMEPNKEELDAKYGPDRWYVIGYEDHRTLIHFPELYALNADQTPVVFVKQEDCDAAHVIVRPIWREPLYSGSLASPSIVADIMYKKFVLCLPFYRLAQHFARKGLALSRQTMTNWINNIADRVLSIMFEYLCALLCLQGHIQNDETTFDVIQDGRKAGTPSYIWAHVTSELDQSVHKIAVFCYELTRGTDHLRNFFNDDRERTMTDDAYVSYKTFKKESNGRITTTGCWMHCRRRFYKALQALQQTLKRSRGKGEKADPVPEVLKNSPENKAVELIGEIYHADEPLKTENPEARKEQRDKKVRPLVDKFYEFIRSINIDAPACSSQLADAVKYALNQEEELRVFLGDPLVPIDNGEVERAQKIVALIRKNSMFFFSVDGAKAGTKILTLTETAKRNGADPYYYLMFLLEDLPPHLTPPPEDKSFLEDLLPWSERYRSYEASRKRLDMEKRAGRFEMPDDKQKPGIEKPPNFQVA